MPIQNRFRGCLRTKSNDLHGVLFNCCDTEKKKNVPIKWTLPWKFSRVCLLCLPGSVRSKATTASMSNTPIIGLCLYVMVEHSNTYEIHYEKLTSRRPACAPLLARPERISGLWSLPCCILKSQWWQLVTDDDMLIVWRFSEQKILIYRKGRLPKNSCKKSGILPNLLHLSPRFVFLREKNWPIFFFLRKWTIDALNKFYTWSHLKIFIFAYVISVALNRP